MESSLGNITWWGLSPALDLQESEIFNAMDLVDTEEVANKAINILLVGSGDIRHIVKTLALRFRHSERSLHFYILENNLELYARAMLQLATALQPLDRIGLQEKTELFLELFGNSLVRQQSMDFAVNMADEFIKCVTDFDYLSTKMSFLDLSALKFKERDILESIFKLWKDKTKTFDAFHCWDLRVRKHLGVRYDAIPSVFDWDCSITLHERGAEIIHSREYATWRRKGVAFELREASYDVSNRTLTSGAVFRTADGDKTARLGYWGDIVCSPYIAFGIHSENKELFKKSNHLYTHGATHVSEYNLLAMFYQLANQKEYSPEATISIGGAQAANEKRFEDIKEEDETEEQNKRENEATDNGDKEVSEEAEVCGDDATLKSDEAPRPSFYSEPFETTPLANVSLHMLSLNSLGDLHKKSRYTHLFHLLYFGNSMVHLMGTTPTLKDIGQETAAIVVENVLFIPQMKKDQVTQYVTRVTEMASNIGCEATSTPDALKNEFLVYRFKK